MKKVKKVRVRIQRKLPTVRVSNTEVEKTYRSFPLDHYSYSTFTKFSTNAFMFKINAINGDYLDTTSSPTNAIGRAGHLGMQTYFGGNESVPVPANNEAEAIKLALEAGRDCLAGISDGFIDYNKTTDCRAKMDERFAFAFLGYLKDINFDPTKHEVLFVEKMMKHRVCVQGRELPIALKGAADLVYRDLEHDRRIVIHDHKFCSKFSNEESTDGAKLLQSIFLYFLVYAETGEAPYSMVYAERKITENRDKAEPQTRFYEMVYADMGLAFEFFYRFYEDITDALMGKQVYVPNIMAIFDKEVSLMAYIHRLDVSEVRAAKLKEAKVENITDFLKKRIEKDGYEKKFMETVSGKFISAKTLNYSDMTIEERIKMKLAEHGIGLEFQSKVAGPTVTLYRYTPSIGVKMSRIEQFNKDVELVTSSTGVRVLAPIPGSDMVGFEVPNEKRTFLGKAPKSQLLRVAIGEDIQGIMQYVDIATAPHILIAGTTGSGKSIILNSIVEAVGGSADLWLMDPKQVELPEEMATLYANTDKTISVLLQELVGIMDVRYNEMKAAKIKNWEGRRIIAVVDEFGDLMLNKKGEGATIEDCITRLAQKARAAGIHLIIATQRPSVNVITGTIKANFPTRIALKTASPKDSEVILGVGGAEKLCGKGDLLLVRSDSNVITRIQGYSS